MGHGAWGMGHGELGMGHGGLGEFLVLSAEGKNVADSSFLSSCPYLKVGAA
ncbi:MAG: hypothetical protein KME19_11790 [Microcoleus vaginatus WJT46-NPBG5]|jgi:hypothetical protein|nr:hypothetical protein [Microcoleus vaginatus WJT46-NPBG5]